MRSFLHSIPAAFARRQLYSKSARELESMQGRMLHDIIRHANATVPHYRGNPLREIRSPEELHSLPLLTKGTMRAEPERFVSGAYEIPGLSCVLTSGSSGEPMRFYHSRAEISDSFSIGHFQFMENGFGPLDTMMHVRIKPAFIGVRPGIPLYRFALGSSDETEGRLLSIMRRLRISMVDAYPSKLALLAARNLAVARPLRLRCAFTHSEMLTPSMRKCVEESFGCPVRNLYGLNEIGYVGWECPHGSMHVHPDVALVEIVDGEGAPLAIGRKGNVVVTSLRRKSMPLIRYWTGDSASLGKPCSCGRGGQVLEVLEGRSNDFITLPSGRLLPGILLIRCLKAIPSILQFQIIQHRDLSLEIAAVPFGKLGDKDTGRIRANLESVLPERLPVSIHAVERIRKGPWKKHRHIVSQVSAGGAEKNRGGGS